MEPEHIMQYVVTHFSKSQDFKGKKVMITSGPTQEAIDPVRFISNHSSGKMGAAIADTFAEQGAQVHLVLGKGAVKPENTSIKIYPVTSAEDMYQASSDLHPQMDICVFAAAVADYAPKNVAAEKIKKDGEGMTIELVKNIDIALTLGKLKSPHQVHVGFALETENEEFYAKSKLEKKNFNLIVLNSMRDAGAGFQHDTNKVRIFTEEGKSFESEVLPKNQIAELIIREIKNLPVKI
jgi:phosphopantothenoylcysteine decarboxylase/phosphopantothenate--cysteine ligase